MKNVETALPVERDDGRLEEKVGFHCGFDFRKFPHLTGIERKQLGGIQDSLTGDPNQKRTGLARLILPTRYDPNRGIYLPLSATRELYRNMTKSFAALPSVISPFIGTDILYFSNALLLPEGWQDGYHYDLEYAQRPKLRVSNTGFLIVTHESDPQTIAQVQESLSWFRTPGKFKKLDAALCQHREYRGFCVVYSGGRSLHLNFVFDTRHLERVPFDALRATRDAAIQEHCAIMTRVYEVYWDEIAGLMKETLNPSFPSDPAMRRVTQWKRIPWGSRVHENTSKVFGFAPGTVVPQLVIDENIRERAARGNKGYLIPPDFSIAHLPATVHRRNRASASGRVTTCNDRMLDELQLECREEWGEYPKPVQLEYDDGEPVIYFKNNASDRNPSTFVKGDYRKLVLRGEQSFNHNFYLPDGLSARETVDHLQMQMGPPPASVVEVTSSFTSGQPDHPFLTKFRKNIEQPFLTKRNTADRDELKSSYRRNMASAVGNIRSLITTPSRMDCLFVGGEGLSKTTSHFLHLAGEGMDAAMARSASDVTQRFGAVASRSIAQSKEKARELSAHPAGDLVRGIVIESFNSHYERACDTLSEKPIPRKGLQSSNLHNIYSQIHNSQPKVFAELEGVRQNLWKNSPFDCGSTVVFPSHQMIHKWHHSRTSRAWYHPQFRPLDNSQDLESLRKTFAISRLVYDELEIDELIHFLSEARYEYFYGKQRELRDWHNRPRSERESIWETCKRSSSAVPESFEHFDELMRLDLGTLSRVTVNVDAIPFGTSTNANDMYRRCHGTAYYVGFRSWMFESDNRHIQFLTTEELPSRILQASYAAHKRRLMRIDCRTPEIYPVRVPLYIDPRAQKTKIEELVMEITNLNANARVIANGCGGIPHTINFQIMKGANDLKDNDISIIPTMLNPEHYSKLNVIGQWLGIPDIIEMQYLDQIHQAVGRNQGFRESGAATTIIAGRRMGKIIESMNNRSNRIQVYKVSR